MHNGLAALACSLLLGCPGPRRAAELPPTSAAPRNGLTQASSAYLRQHSADPVNWQPWSQAALDSARDQRRLIFVSSGYASCHWCHVMQAEVFSQREVADLLNANFVCLKLDREEQPELDAQLLAVQRSLSAEAGWPLNVWLTPEGKPFFAAAGMKKADFLAVCQRMLDTQRSSPALLDSAGTEVAASLRGALASVPGIVDINALRAAALQELQQADAQWGGAAGAKKFLLPSRWRYALAYQRFFPDAGRAKQLRLTLDRLADGAIHDQIGGGFHRYTEDAQWQQPHFEKLLPDNAQLASLFLEAGAAFRERRYEAVATDTLEFMLRELQAPGGGFYASLSAVDAQGEGAFYRWTTNEVIAAAGPADGAALARVLGLPAGEPDAAGLPDRRTDLPELARELGTKAGYLAELPAMRRTQLLGARARRAAPPADRKLVTAWNGLAISALARAYLLTGRWHYLDAARRAAAAVTRANSLPDGGLLRATTDGRGEQPAGPADYALLASGLCDLYQASGDSAYLESALQLLDRPELQPGYGGLASPLLGGAAIGTGSDGPEPSAGAALLHSLLQAAQLTGDARYSDRAKALLDANGASINVIGIEAAWWLHGALLLDRGLHSVVIAGDPAAPATVELRQAYAGVGAPNAGLCCIAAAGAPPEQLALQPLLADKTAASRGATAYVCTMASCRTPVQDAAGLDRELRDATGVR